MGVIQGFLNTIVTAIHGEDVRWSIHNAIEQCYKDATGHPDSVAAVVKENEAMKNLLDNTPYTTALEDTDAYELPIHTIRDNEVSENSTWSSSKIQSEQQSFILTDSISVITLIKKGLTEEQVNTEIFFNVPLAELTADGSIENIADTVILGVEEIQKEDVYSRTAYTPSDYYGNDMYESYPYATLSDKGLTVYAYPCIGGEIEGTYDYGVRVTLLNMVKVRTAVYEEA